MKFFLLLIATIFMGVSLYASDEDTKVKPEYKFGGVVDFHLYSDSYESYDYRNGVLYFIPKAPSINSVGVDENDVGSLRGNIFTSRLTFGVTNIKISEKATAMAYIETDFAGSENDYLQLMRIRHAYTRIDWGKSSMLFGQTWHLGMVVEVMTNALTVGSFPFVPICRNPQIQYTYRVNDLITLDGAAMAHLTMPSAGPSESQANAMIPDLSARIKLGDPNKLFGGVTLSSKFLKPRTHTDEGYEVENSVSSFSVSGFFKAVSHGVSFRAYAMYGGNLSQFTMFGGYGKLLGDDASGDYGYTNVRSITSFADLELPRFGKWEVGFMGGYQRSFGTADPVDLTKDSSGSYMYGYYMFSDLESVYRVSSRLVYHILPGKLFTGIEYGMTAARWGKEFDEYFRPTECYDWTRNNRIEFVTKLMF